MATITWARCLASCSAPCWLSPLCGARRPGTLRRFRLPCSFKRDYLFQIYYDHDHLGKVFGFVFRTVLAEPVVWSPQTRDFEKVLSTTWMVMIFVLLQAYSGTLMAILAAPSFPIPINR